MKFQEYFVPKRYKRRVKRYRNILLRIPKSCQPKIEPYLGRDLDMKEVVARETADETILEIVLAAKKHVIGRQLEQTA